MTNNCVICGEEIDRELSTPTCSYRKGSCRQLWYYRETERKKILDAITHNKMDIVKNCTIIKLEKLGFTVKVRE